MKKIFISGASGFIGKNLVKLLSKKNYRIFCLTRKKKYKLANTKWLVGELNDNYQEYLKDADLLIHCATTGVYEKESSKKIYKTNFHDSLKFLKQAYKAGCKNWIILGTSGEYGYVTNGPMSPKTKLKPVDTYGKSKVLFYKKLKKLKIRKKCKILYIRIFHVYGKEPNSKRLYTGLVRAAKKNLNFKMTLGEEIRDFVSVDFVVNKIHKSFKLFSKKNFFLVKHIARGKPLKVKDFAMHHWKKQKAKKSLLFGNIKTKNLYHTMYSDKTSLL